MSKLIHFFLCPRTLSPDCNVKKKRKNTRSRGSDIKLVTSSCSRFTILLLKNIPYVILFLKLFWFHLSEPSEVKITGLKHEATVEGSE